MYLITTYGPSKPSRETDLDINTKTGFIQNSLFYCCIQKNYAMLSLMDLKLRIIKEKNKLNIQLKIKITLR